MQSQLYYQSPEKAIYMARFFEMRLVDQFGEPIRFELVDGSLEFVPMRSPRGKPLPCLGAFVDIESHRILLPRKGDLVVRRDKSVVIMDKDFEFNETRGTPEWRLIRAVNLSRLDAKVLRRNTYPFLQPLLAIWKVTKRQQRLSPWQYE